MKTILTAFSLVILTSSTSAQVPSYVPTNGLVGWWGFNGNANDESGNGNDGIVNGPTLTTNRFGDSNAAYAFDGVDDFIEAPLSTFTGDFTFQLWFSTSNTSTNRCLFESTSGYLDFNTTAYGSGSLFWGQGTSGSNCNAYSGPLSSFNQWHSVTLVNEANMITIQYDGAPIALMLCPNPPAQWSSFVLGKRPDNTDHFNGVFDDLAIWNRALTSAEIAALYNSVPAAPCVSPTPVSFTGLGTSYTVNDAQITLTGSPTGGVFIGPGITGSTFDPASAGVGTHSITYTFVDGSNCINTAGQCTEVTLNTTTGGTHMAEGGVHIFPNPTNGLFNVEFELQGLVSLQVFDATGRLAHSEVFQCNGSRTLRSLNLVGLAKGGYTVQVQNNGGTVTQQVVIE